MSILTIRDGCVPPTINLDDPDPEAAGMDLTPNVAEEARDPDRAQQLVRVRRPEHGPDLPGAAGMTDEAAAEGAVPEPSDGGDVDLLALIDRLAGLLERSDLTELEVESGGTGVILRKPVAVAPAAGGEAAPAAGQVAGRGRLRQRRAAHGGP